MEDLDPATPQPSSQALPEGTCLEGFVIESVFGRGRFTNTYLARDIELGKIFVLKEHLPEALCYRDPDSLAVASRETGDENAAHFAWSVESFRKEAEALASLNHPGIVRVLGGFPCFGTAYFAMPFVEGSSLEEQLQIRNAYGPEFTEEELNGLLWRMLETLNYLHDRRIFHQGIRAENILINEEGIPSLIGFTGARRRLCQRISIEMESSGYTAVEQTIAFSKVGPQSDIYALGAILFTLITGSTPAVATALLPRVPSIPLAQRENLGERFSQRLLRSIDKALEPDPDDRYLDGAAWWNAVWGNAPAEESEEKRPAARPSSAPIAKEAARPSPKVRASTTGAVAPKVSPSTPVVETPQIPVSPPVAVTPEVRASPEVAAVAIPPAREDEATALFTELSTPRSVLTDRLLAGAVVVIVILTVALGYSLSRETSPAPPALSVSPPKKEVDFTPPTPAVPEPAPAPDLAIVTPAPAAGLAPTGMTGGIPEKPRVTELPQRPGMEGTEAGEVRQFGGIEMAWCPPGTFSMGSPWNEIGRFTDETPHQVVLTRGYWIAKTETTQTQWLLITAENPSWRKGDNLPVERLSWADVQIWLEKKNAQDPLPAGWKWSLPSEAQWEYACRAGTTTAIYTGPLEILGAQNAPALDEIAWYGGNSSVGYSGPGMDTSEWEEKQYPGGLAGEREVGGKLPNAWGLHDMIGNVWEWCADWSGPYGIGTVIDPVGPATGEERVMRGGSWANGPDLGRSAVRSGNPGNGGDGLGFRCVIVPSVNPGL